MDEILNTYIAFRGDFTFPDSILETAPGEELADLLVKQLPEYAILAENDGEPDFAHYVECKSSGAPFVLMVGGEQDEIDGGILWFIMLTRPKRCWRKNDIEDQRSACRKLLFAINEIIQECNQIREVRWYPQFDDFLNREWMLPSPGPVRDPELDEHLRPLWRLESILFKLNPVSMLVWIGLIILAAYNDSKTLLGLIVYLFIGWWIVGPLIIDRWIKQASERRAREEQL